jgi:hypothetical protein
MRMQIQEGQMRYQWLRLPESHKPGQREAILMVVTFGIIMFLGMML